MDSDDLNHQRKRLAWRATHRGTREVDLLLGAFAEINLETMDGPTLDAFERFLSYPDQDMQHWLTRSTPLPGGLPDGLRKRLEAFDYVAEQKGA